jgi:hypothetical protein
MLSAPPAHVLYANNNALWPNPGWVFLNCLGRGILELCPCSKLIKKYAGIFRALKNNGRTLVIVGPVMLPISAWLMLLPIETNFGCTLLYSLGPAQSRRFLSMTIIEENKAWRSSRGLERNENLSPLETMA